ncbi:hypothetical protein EP47_03790 [Legionella norrlandica]|uniref:N-acetyltransferase domain-containing protein n=1 Tax=Legionella norrlandica TaxID=1498499 RepID=A0A0A2T9F9_9GAMM|nr:GNAT family N-acetyltransferase [Legionella norrlandica]KGP64053.1 hypothetical protein EP47_03790 [Legionella norrlandica]
MPIRRLTLGDKSQVLALDKVIFSTVDPEGGWRESDFNQFFNEESCYVFYEEKRPDVIIGYIFATQEKDQTYISNLGSDPRTGKRGIGTALMQKVMLQEDENSKKNNRPFAIKLHADNDNENAIRFYKNLGFKEEGRDSHGIKMTATALPEKFKNKEIQPPVPMSRKALIIRNVDGIQYDDLKVALDGLEPDEQAPREFNELIHLVQSNTLSDSDRLNHALDLFKLEIVRDYIYETVKEKTGSYVIYHLNGLEDTGRINNKNATYIIEKMAKIAPNTDFDMLYLGGGHGDPSQGLSNLSKRQLEGITDILNNRNIKFSAVILGSCFSTAYLGLCQPFLKDHGVTISNSLECGGDNNFKPAMQWIKGQRQEFYSDEDIRNSIPVYQETRAAMRRVFEGGVPPGEELPDEYSKLLDAYKQFVQTEVPGLPEEEFYALGEDLFNRDLEEFIIEMQFERELLHKEKIQEILGNYPKLSEHIKILADKKGEKAIFDALTNCIKPTPTSLVVGTAKTVTMFNFSEANVMPANADEEFQGNYRLVRDKVRRSGQFTEINEVLNDFNDISAKRQFNNVFIQATKFLEPQEREAQKHHPEQERLIRQQQEREAQERHAEQERLIRQQQEREAQDRAEQERLIHQQQEREVQEHRAEQKGLAHQQQERETQYRDAEQERLTCLQNGHAQNQQAFAAQLKLLHDKMTDLDKRGMEKARRLH